MEPVRYAAPQLIADYRRAFEAANNKPAPRITYEQGWFRFWEGDCAYLRRRKADMETMLGRLRARVECNVSR